MNNPLRESSVAEVPLQASKWLQIPVLLDPIEMEQLLNEIQPLFFFQCGTITNRGEGEISIQEFLHHYTLYVQTLKEGSLPPLSSYQSPFSVAMTSTPDCLFTIPIQETKQLIRIAQPIIQLQAHHIHYSSLDKKFRSMILGSESIPWGIQFSYPQIFQSPHSNEIKNTRKDAEATNAVLFQTIQRWIRQHTIPTPFFADNILQNTPIRLGRECLTWINHHQQLINKNIQVKF